MSNVHADKIVKELGSLDLVLQFALFCELLDASDRVMQEDIVYSKSYFSRYYCVDLETFNKWIQVFCPELWADNYNRKRKFTIAEANFIFESLGRITAKKMPPQDRKELMAEIYKDKAWKKSKRYDEISLDLEDRFPDCTIKLNKLPPKLVFQILKEELEEYDETIPGKKEEYFRTRVHVFQSVFSKFTQLSEHKAEVYRRYIRRSLLAKDDTPEEYEN